MFVRRRQATERARHNFFATTAGGRLAEFWRGRCVCFIFESSGEQNLGFEVVRGFVFFLLFKLF